MIQHPDQAVPTEGGQRDVLRRLLRVSIRQSQLRNHPAHGFASMRATCLTLPVRLGRLTHLPWS